MLTPGSKPALRRRLLATRRETARACPEAAARLVGHFPQHLMPGHGSVVAGYRAMRSEIDPLLLMQAMADRGAVLALPVMQGEGRPLLFRRWQAGARLAAGAYGVEEPTPDAPALVPDLVLVPLVGVDRAGVRLGMGKGFYDHTLAGLRERGRVLAVGCAFDTQRVETLPSEPHDQRLDALVTDRGFTDFSDTAS
jgi:5-formyltetrahydrofolate cyclo-ligase